MKIITSYKAVAHILHLHDDRELREIAEQKDVILELIEEKHLYTLTGQEVLVAQLAGPDGNDLYGYELVDWYLACDTESKLMTAEEKEHFKKIGGEIRG